MRRILRRGPGALRLPRLPGDQGRCDRWVASLRRTLSPPPPTSPFWRRGEGLFARCAIAWAISAEATQGSGERIGRRWVGGANPAYGYRLRWDPGDRPPPPQPSPAVRGRELKAAGGAVRFACAGGVAAFV